jgi:CTP synthase
LEDGIKSKISMFCHVAPEQVLGVHDCKSVYHVPFLLAEQGMVTILERKLHLNRPPSSPWGSSFFSKWRQLADRYDRLHDDVKIVLVGKYTNLQDSYISVVKSLQHAALSCNRKLALEVLFLTK